MTAGTGPATDPQPKPTPTPPPAKMPATNLAFTLSGTKVNLTWTGHTNPDFVRQVVKRRVAGVFPLDWTEFATGLSDTSHADTTAEAGTTYMYRVQGFTETSGPNGWLSNPLRVEVPAQ